MKRSNDEEDPSAQAGKKARLFDDDANNNAIPIFLRKTYKMIDACDPEICSWTDDGEMFVVKQPVSWLGHVHLDVPHPNAFYTDTTTFASCEGCLRFRDHPTILRPLQVLVIW